MVNVALHQIVCMISLLVLYVMLPLLLAIEVTLLTPPPSQESCCYIMKISLQRLTLTLIGLQLSAIFMQGRGGEIWIIELLIPCIPIELIWFCCNFLLKVRYCIHSPFPKGVLDSTQIHSLDCIYVTMKFTGNV